MTSKTLRRIHVLLGIFFAPTIVFFALTGVMQVLELQDRREGREPPDWILHAVDVHQHQKWQFRRRPPQPPPTASAPAGASILPATSAPEASAAPRPVQRPQPPPPSIGTLILKPFTVLMALGLTITAALGVWMSWLVPRDRKLVVALLVSGTLLPAVLLMI